MGFTPKHTMPKNKAQVRVKWQSLWEESLALWSNYIKLRQPVFCMSDKEAGREGLTDSFAMIRLYDHQIVINVEGIVKHDLSDFEREILAHEIGHHVYVPGNLHDLSRQLSRTRWGLAGIEDRAPLIMNLYSDQLINHYLHSEKNLDFAGVYKKLQRDSNNQSGLWTWYMRTYEHLWGLSKGELTGKVKIPQNMEADASLTASIIKTYSREWIDGAGRFAAMAYPYVLEEKDFEDANTVFGILNDTKNSGEGAKGLSGILEIDEVELSEIIDPRAEALQELEEKGSEGDDSDGLDPGESPGAKKRKKGEKYREPGSFIEMTRQLDPSIHESEVVKRYYRERALPHLIPFPSEPRSKTSERQPEGTETWDVGDPFEELDLFESALESPEIIPGFSTKKRVYGISDDPDDRPEPVNLYIGIDCSGSMYNPAHNISWPVLAGTVTGLSALRAGAKVKAVLSGEPGSHIGTKDFTTVESDILSILTSYIGTGYAFGLNRLSDTFSQKLSKKTHILIITDQDIFQMLKEQAKGKRSNRQITETAIENALGGGTLLLHGQEDEYYKDELKDFRQMGWQVHFVTSEKDLVRFATAFSKIKYGDS